VGTEKRARQKANRQARLDELARDQRNRSIRRRVLTWGGLIALFVVAAVVISMAFGGDDDPEVDASGTTSPPTTAADPLPCPPADGSASPTQEFPAPPPMCIDPAKTYTAEIVTNEGPVTVELDAQAAPNAVNSFVYLARYHFFDGVPCHRIISGFVVQCGDPTGSGSGGPGYEFDDELPSEPYAIGDLAMANSGPNTNGSQFFIITGEQGAALPLDYTRFGRVTAGMDSTVVALDAAADPNATNGVPTAEPIALESVTITET
jgi:cyclophilin family peptidyl-prolyl cis-trans isomerase